MHILYKITYLPHINTKYPKYYIGSKYNYKSNYLGSISSKQVYDYTEGKQLKDWWKEQKKYSERFKFEIIEEFNNITPEELVIKERDLHLTLDVLSEEYFNHSVATKGFCSRKRSDETKQKVAKKTKDYWNSNAGLLKKQRLAKRNESFQSNIMKNKWKNPSSAMINRKITGRPKGAKDLNERKPKNNVRKIYHNGQIYDNAIEAAEKYNVDPVTIRRWCKNKLNYWSYL